MGPGSWAPATASPTNQWADLHALLWSSSLPGPCPKHLEHTQQNSACPPASPLLAMAWWRLALLLMGALLAGERSLGLAPLGGRARGQHWLQRPLQRSKLR